MQNTELRPLGAGEILDRAVTLFVNRFVPIVVVLAAATVPLMALDAWLSPGTGLAFNDLAGVFAAGGNRAASQAAIAALTRDSGASGVTFLMTLLGIAVNLAMWSAIVAVVSAAYAGTSVTLGAAYRIGLRCWFGQAVIGMAFGFVASLAAIPLFIAYLFAIFGIFGLVALKAEVIAAIFGAVAGIVVLAAALLAGAWIYMTYEIATVALVTEGVNPVTAIASAFRRTASRRMWWRAVVAGTIAIVITYVGLLPIVAAATLLTALTHIGALYYAISGVGTILLDGVLASFVVVYATDVRVRREGIDLLALSQPLPT